MHEGDDLIVDGNSGVVYVNPRATCAREYERLDREYRAFNRELEALRDLPAETTDGHRVTLYANIGLIGDLPFAHRHGAEGVGLYRTEFPFLTYRDFPDEEEQLRALPPGHRCARAEAVTIRTLDLGADKYPSYLRLGKEENPFLGWRSIRISLEMPRSLQAAAARHPSRRRARPRAHAVPDDLEPRGDPARQGAARGGAARAAAKRRSPSTRRCRSAS